MGKEGCENINQQRYPKEKGKPSTDGRNALPGQPTEYVTSGNEAETLRPTWEPEPTAKPKSKSHNQGDEKSLAEKH